MVFEGDSAVLKTGQWFAVVTPGAGGFGPPDKRDPAAVARDLRRGRHVILPEARGPAELAGTWLRYQSRISAPVHMTTPSWPRM